MHLHVSSVSTGKAARTAATILDRYLTRVGVQNWSGEISWEGVRDLKQRLKPKVSPGMALCFRLSGSPGREGALSYIGNRRRFGPDGEIPVSWSKGKRRRAAIEMGNSPLSMLRPALGLAAAFHDLGKLSEAFTSEVLLKSVRGEKSPGQPLRHEYLSLVLLHRMIVISAATTDQEFLARCFSLREDGQASGIPGADLLMKAWNSLLAGDASHYLQPFKWGEDTNLDLSNAFIPDASAFPLMHAVAHLTLNHHRLAYTHYEGPSSNPRHGAARQGRGREYLRPDNHVSNWLFPASVAATSGDKLLPEKVLKKYLTPHPALRAELLTTWQLNLGFHAKLAAETLAALSDRSPSMLQGEAWQLAGGLMGRLLFMLGDHDGSARSRKTRTREASLEEGKRHPFANTASWDGRAAAEDEDELGDPPSVEEIDTDEPAAHRPPRQTASTVLADRWGTHIHRVTESSKLSLRMLGRLNELPSLAEAPAKLREPIQEERFRWQEQAGNLLQAKLAELPVESGALVLLLAGTGMGKTIGAARIITADGRPVRLTTLLGLRSLTLQTGDEYIKNLGFDEDDATVIVGSSTAELLHNLSSQILSGDRVEEEDLPEADEDLITLGEHGRILPALLQRQARDRRGRPNRRKENLLAYPVVVTTADTLVASLDMKRSRYVYPMLRTMSSDLIIDEIDSYSPEDVAILLMLVHLSAIAGRKVVLASATMPADIAQAAYLAYAHGQRRRGLLLGRECHFALGWVSESLQDIQDSRTVTDEAAFVARHGDISERQHAALLAAPGRRKWDVIHPSAPDDGGCWKSEGDMFSDITSSALELHKLNHVTDPETGKRVSVGFVRWNNIKVARNYAKHVFQHGFAGQADVAVLCYHSRFPAAVRNIIEKTLSTMLKRGHRQGDVDPLLMNPLVRHHVRRSTTDDLVILISTTPILETGRDFDADWAITEPCSEHSTIQLAGRLRRHRPWEWGAVNMLCLHHAAKGISAPFAQPGFESPDAYQSAGAKHQVPLSALRVPANVSRTAEAIFDGETWRQCLDARIVFKPTGSVAGAVDSRRRRLMLLGEPVSASANSPLEKAQASLVNDIARRLSVATMVRPEGLIGTEGAREMKNKFLDDYFFRNRIFRRSRPGMETVVYRMRRETWHFNLSSTISGKNKQDDKLAEMGSHIIIDWEPTDDMLSRSLIATDEMEPWSATWKLMDSLKANNQEAPGWLYQELSAISIELHRDKAHNPSMLFHPLLGGTPA